MTMAGGKLRHLVTLQTRLTTAGNRGQRSSSYSNVKTVHCGIESLSGSELDKARELVEQASVKIVLRYDPTQAITIEDRIVFGTVIFNIGHIANPDQANKWLVLICEEE